MLVTAGLASVGIWLVAGAAAAFNCLIEQHIDARMKRTAWRPTARGDLSRTQALAFSAGLGGLGMVLLYIQVNPLTMWLTFGTFVGYAVDLHRHPQAADAAEHRHRRRLGGDAAGAGLGGDDRLASARRRWPCS